MVGSSTARELLGHSVNTTENRVEKRMDLERQGEGRRGAVTCGFSGAPGGSCVHLAIRVWPHRCPALPSPLAMIHIQWEQG